MRLLSTCSEEMIDLPAAPKNATSQMNFMLPSFVKTRGAAAHIYIVRPLLPLLQGLNRKQKYAMENTNFVTWNSTNNRWRGKMEFT